MSVSLREVLGLADARQAVMNDQAAQFKQLFTEGITGINSHLQTMAGQANPADFQPLEAQKMKLYEAFQKTSSLIDPLNPNRGEQSIERVMAAVKAIEGKVAETAGGLAAGRDEWLKREDEFDNVLVRVGELEEAGNPKAATLRKLADTIREKVNARTYDQSVTAFDQLRPKFDQIYQQHQQSTGVENGAGSGLGGVFPEIQWEQIQGDLKEAESKISQMEEAQFPKSPVLRKALATIQSLGANNQVKGAVDGFNRLRQQVESEFAKLEKGRAGGVRIPEGLENMTAAKASATGQSGMSKGGPINGGPAPKAPATGAAPAKSPAGFITGTVGKGGKNSPADVKAVQEALNQRGGAKLTADGKFGPKTLKAIEDFQKKLGQFKPDGVIQPGRGTARALSGAAAIPPTPPVPKPIAPPVLGKASLDKGALVWHSTRGILNTNIEELKKGVRAAYGTEHKDLLTAIDGSMVNLNKVVDKLDTRLADALDSAYKAPEGPARVGELKKAESIMKDYLKYVDSEPLIGHMDDNPFGVKTSLKQIIGDALNHLTELIPPPADAVA